MPDETANSARIRRDHGSTCARSALAPARGSQPYPARNGIGPGDLQVFRGQAARVYSLTRPSRTGFRRICCLSMSVTVARGREVRHRGRVGRCPGAGAVLCIWYSVRTERRCRSPRISMRSRISLRRVPTRRSLLRRDQPLRGIRSERRVRALPVYGCHHASWMNSYDHRVPGTHQERQRRAPQRIERQDDQSHRVSPPPLSGPERASRRPGAGDQAWHGYP